MAKIKIIWSSKADKRYGKIIKMDFPNKSKIFISSTKGFVFSLPYTKKREKEFRKRGNFEIHVPINDILPK